MVSKILCILACVQRIRDTRVTSAYTVLLRSIWNALDREDQFRLEPLQYVECTERE
jgi:hypothetical protein